MSKFPFTCTAREIRAIRGIDRIGPDTDCSFMEKL
jgi:hypothetical protein